MFGDRAGTGPFRLALYPMPPSLSCTISPPALAPAPARPDRGREKTLSFSAPVFYSGPNRNVSREPASPANPECCRATDRYRQPGILSQGDRLPVRLPGPHPGARVHPPDQRETLRRGLPAQLGVQRLSRRARPGLRPALRAGLPPRPGGAGTGGHLPAEAVLRRPPRPGNPLPAAGARPEKRQAHRPRRRRPGLADRGPRPAAARLHG